MKTTTFFPFDAYDKRSCPVSYRGSKDPAVGCLSIASLFPPNRAGATSASAAELQQPKRRAFSKQDVERVETDCYMGDFNSIALEIPLVAYPREARRKEVSGKVAVKVFVNESGDVYHAVAVDGPALLRKAAFLLVRIAKFKPFIQEDKPTQCAGILNYTFNKPD